MITLIIAIFSVSVIAQETVNVTLNEKAIEFDQPPIIVDGRTLVPVRAIFEALGADVYWYENFMDGGVNSVLIVKNEIKLFIGIGQTDFGIIKGYYGEGQTITEIATGYFDVPPQVVNDRTLLPIRFLCEQLNVIVNWDDINKNVFC